MKKKQTNCLKFIGRKEKVRFPFLSEEWLDAKIDTGAYTSSIHCSQIHETIDSGKKMLCFTLYSNNPNTKSNCFEHFTKKKIKSSTGESEDRYVIKTLIEIAGKKIKTTISLADRGSMKCPVLIGRKLIKRKFIVDVSKTYTGGITTENIY